MKKCMILLHLHCLGINLVIKLRNSDFESQDMTSDFNMSNEKEMFDFVPIPLFGSCLVIKLRNFDIEGQ